MGKKKEVVINPKSAPADVESGDVNILYHHTLIGSLSDDGQARLETQNTVCLHDIGVEYAPAIKGSKININKQSGRDLFITAENGVIVRDNAVIPDNGMRIGNGETEWVGIPKFHPAANGYFLSVHIASQEAERIVDRDDVNVTVNGTPVEYDGDDNVYYLIDSVTETVVITSYNIVITDKEK